MLKNGLEKDATVFPRMSYSFLSTLKIVEVIWAKAKKKKSKNEDEDDEFASSDDDINAEKSGIDESDDEEDSTGKAQEEEEGDDDDDDDDINAPASDAESLDEDEVWDAMVRSSGLSAKSISGADDEDEDNFDMEAALLDDENENEDEDEDKDSQSNLEQDGLIGDDADQELASMFNDENEDDDSDDGSDDAESFNAEPEGKYFSNCYLLSNSIKIFRIQRQKI